MLAFFTFYKGYYAICKGPGHASALTIYYVSQTLQLILFLVFTIIKSACFNGFVKLVVLSRCGLKFSLVVGVVEIVLYYVCILIGVYSLISIKKNYGQSEPFRSANYEMQNQAHGGTD